MSDMGWISVILKITYRDANPEGEGMSVKMRPWRANSVLGLSLHSGTVTLIKKKKRGGGGELALANSVRTHHK